VVRVGLRVTGCIGWLAINGPSAVIGPLRALIMAGMYTLTLPLRRPVANRPLLCFLVVISGDTLRRVWVTIGAGETACKPANGGTYSLRSFCSLLSCMDGIYGRLTKACSGDTIVKKNMARHLQVIHAHVQVR